MVFDYLRFHAFHTLNQLATVYQTRMPANRQGPIVLQNGNGSNGTQMEIFREYDSRRGLPVVSRK